MKELTETDLDAVADLFDAMPAMAWVEDDLPYESTSPSWGSVMGDFLSSLAKAYYVTEDSKYLTKADYWLGYALSKRAYEQSIVTYDNRTIKAWYQVVDGQFDHNYHGNFQIVRGIARLGYHAGPSYLTHVDEILTELEFLWSDTASLVGTWPGVANGYGYVYPDTSPAAGGFAGKRMGWNNQLNSTAAMCLMNKAWPTNPNAATWTPKWKRMLLSAESDAAFQAALTEDVDTGAYIYPYWSTIWDPTHDRENSNQRAEDSDHVWSAMSALHDIFLSGITDGWPDGVADMTPFAYMFWRKWCRGGNVMDTLAEDADDTALLTLTGVAQGPSNAIEGFKEGQRIYIWDPTPDVYAGLKVQAYNRIITAVDVALNRITLDQPVTAAAGNEVRAMLPRFAELISGTPTWRYTWGDDVVGWPSMLGGYDNTIFQHMLAYVNGYEWEKWMRERSGFTAWSSGRVADIMEIIYLKRQGVLP